MRMTAIAPPVAVAGAKMVSWSGCMALSDPQPLSDAQGFGVADVIPAYQLRHGHVIAACDSAQCVAPFHDVGGPENAFAQLFVQIHRIHVLFEVGRILGVDLLLVGYVLGDVALRKNQCVGFCRGRNNIQFVLRVELSQHLDRQIDGRCDLSEVEQPVDTDRIHGDGNRRLVEVDVVLPVIGVGIGRTDECRHVTARFGGQVVVDVPEAVAFVDRARTSDGLVHIARPAVVGGDGQRPIAVEVVEVAQIAHGGLRRADGVAAFVDHRIDFQSVAFGRRGHELPQPDGSHTRGGGGDEGRFDDRHGAQFDRQIGFEQFLLDEREVVLRCAQNTGCHLALFVHVEVDAVFDHGVVGERNRRNECSQASGIERIRHRVASVFDQAVDSDVTVEKVRERVRTQPFVPDGKQRIGLLGRESQRDVIDRSRFDLRFGLGDRFGFWSDDCGGRCHRNGLCDVDSSFSVFFAGAAFGRGCG